MAKTLTLDEKIAFVNANLSSVPSKQKEWFTKQDVDKQYKKMLEYLRRAKKPTTKSTLNVNSVVKSITSKNPTPKQVESIIKKLQEWCNDATSRQLSEIDKQIAELMKKKENLSK